MTTPRDSPVRVTLTGTVFDVACDRCGQTERLDESVATLPQVRAFTEQHRHLTAEQQAESAELTAERDWVERLRRG